MTTKCLQTVSLVTRVMAILFLLIVCLVFLPAVAESFALAVFLCSLLLLVLCFMPSKVLADNRILFCCALWLSMLPVAVVFCLIIGLFECGLLPTYHGRSDLLAILLLGILALGICALPVALMVSDVCVQRERSSPVAAKELS